MSASRKKRAARRRRKILRAVEAAPIDATWTRIGPWDAVRRRSVWMREVYRDTINGTRAVADLERIEIKAGREGRDEVLVIDRTNPQLHALHEVFCRMRYIVEMSRDPA